MADTFPCTNRCGHSFTTLRPYTDGEKDAVQKIHDPVCAKTAAGVLIEPDEVFDYYGTPCARWGSGVTRYDEERDPTPSVYASGAEIEAGEMRLSLDEAEQWAARILNAVRYQREQVSGA